MEGATLKACSNISFTLFAPKENVKKIILFVPGGGKTLGKERFLEWQKELLLHGIASASFDFPGIGESPGNLEHSSLEERIKNTECVYAHFRSLYPDADLILYGVSMGGYIALGVVDRTGSDISTLILQTPAAYKAAAHTLPLDASFTQAIRSDGSWIDSKSFMWLEKYKGKVMLIEGEKDIIIPHDIITRYQKTKTFHPMVHYSLPEMEHNVWSNSEKHGYLRSLIMKEILRFIEKQ